MGKQKPCKHAVWQTDTLRPPRLLISGVAVVKGGCVPRDDMSTTAGVCHGDVPHHTHPQHPTGTDTTGWWSLLNCRLMRSPMVPLGVWHQVCKYMWVTLSLHLHLVYPLVFELCPSLNTERLPVLPWVCKSGSQVLMLKQQDIRRRSRANPNHKLLCATDLSSASVMSEQEQSSHYIRDVSRPYLSSQMLEPLPSERQSCKMFRVWAINERFYER